jgi:MFS family permease
VPAAVVRVGEGIDGAAPRSRGRQVWVPAAAVLVGTGWGSNQVTPMLLVYGQHLGLSGGTVEAMFGVYALGLIPGLLLAGPLSDARGRRRLAIAAASLSLAASVALVAGEHTVALLFLGRLLAGVSSGAAFGAATAWAYGLCLVAGLVAVQRLADPKGLARLTAIYYALTYVGFAVPYLLVLLTHLASYAVLLSTLAVLAGVTTLVIRWQAPGHLGGSDGHIRS